MPDSPPTDQTPPLSPSEWQLCWKTVAAVIGQHPIDPHDQRHQTVLQLLNALDYHYARDRADAFHQTFRRLLQVLDHPEPTPDIGA